VARITAWVETMTGLRMSVNNAAEKGVAEMMTPAEWKDRKAELEKLGGAPIAFPK
jgi:hypothetical protein